MKKKYLKPSMVAVKIERGLMQFVSGEQTTTGVDPSQKANPSEAMSRDYRSFSLWDEE
jgi:hypothetical protein